MKPNYTANCHIDFSLFQLCSPPLAESFSTLYTKINLQDLKQVLTSLLDKAFKGGTCEYIEVTRTDAKFVKKKKNETTFTRDERIQMLEYIIDNAYFSAGNKCYQQIVGIPMGTDPAPYIANLYLYHYEYEWMEKIEKTDNITARRCYSYTRRFIDDLCTLNNNEDIKKNRKKICATFLDLDIEIKNNRYVTKIFDKRDQFNFDIISYPDLRGNIPPRLGYGVYIGQVLRISRNTTHLEDFVDRVRKVRKNCYIRSIMTTYYARLYSSASKDMTRYQRSLTPLHQY